MVRAGRLQKADTEPLVASGAARRKRNQVYMAKNGERRRELVRCAAKLLPPLPELQEKMEAVTFRAVEKVAVNRGEDDALKRALNRLYDEAVAQGILQENSVKKLLVTVRSEGEKADKNMNQRILTLGQMRMLTALCIEGMHTDIRYAICAASFDHRSKDGRTMWIKY